VLCYIVTPSIKRSNITHWSCRPTRCLKKKTFASSSERVPSSLVYQQFPWRHLPLHACAFLPRVQWELHGAIYFEVIIYGQSPRFTDSYGVSCLTAGNTYKLSVKVGTLLLPAHYNLLHKAQTPLGSSRQVSTRHDTFDVSGPYILAVSSLSNNTARHARLDALDTSNVSRRVETWRDEPSVIWTLPIDFCVGRILHTILS